MTPQEFHGSDLEKISAYYEIPQDSIINFAGNVNPFGISDGILDKLKSNLSLLSQYPDRSYTSLKNSIASYTNTDTQHILVGSGSTELINLGISHIASKKALILGPTYSEYERELHLLGCTLSQYKLPLDQDLIDSLSDIYHTLLEGYDFLIICNPNNPTGKTWNNKELFQLLSFCKEHAIFVMVDETYIEFAEDISNYTAIPLCRNFNNLLVLRGFSKFFAAPGIRLGYGITSNHDLITTINLHQNPWSINSLGAYAGELMLMDKEYIEKTRALILSEKRILLNHLKLLNHFQAYDSQSNFILVKLLSNKLTSFVVFETCIKEGLFIRDCKSFFGDEGEFIRFCIMNPKDNETLLQVLQKLDAKYS